MHASFRQWHGRGTQQQQALVGQAGPGLVGLAGPRPDRAGNGQVRKPNRAGRSHLQNVQHAVDRHRVDKELQQERGGARSEGERDRERGEEGACHRHTSGRRPGQERWPRALADAGVQPLSARADPAPGRQPRRRRHPAPGTARMGAGGGLGAVSALLCRGCSSRARAEPHAARSSKLCHYSPGGPVRQ